LARPVRRSILTEKIARRGHHIFREYSVDPFDIHRIAEVMDRSVPTVPTAMSVRELARRVAGADPELARRQGTPIVDGSGRLVGIVTRSDLMRALEKDPDGRAGVLEAGTRDPIVGHEDELIREAVERMLSHGIGRLSIVAREDPSRLIGYLGRSGIVAARQRPRARRPARHFVTLYASASPLGSASAPPRYRCSQSMTVLCQRQELPGFRTQWPSSGNMSSFEGTF
jgi:CBS domain-containing protein